MEVNAVTISALQSMNQAAIAVGESVATLAPALENFGRQLWAMIWDAYRKAGAPYGETDEGLNQWLKADGFTTESGITVNKIIPVDEF